MCEKVKNKMGIQVSFLNDHFIVVGCCVKLSSGCFNNYSTHVNAQSFKSFSKASCVHVPHNSGVFKKDSLVWFVPSEQKNMYMLYLHS